MLALKIILTLVLILSPLVVMGLLFQSESKRRSQVQSVTTVQVTVPLSMVGQVEVQEPVAAGNVALGRSLPQWSRLERILALAISKQLRLRPPCQDR